MKQKVIMMIGMLEILTCVLCGCVGEDTDWQTLTDKTMKAITDKKNAITDTEPAIEFTDYALVDYMIMAEIHKSYDTNNYSAFPEGPDSPPIVITAFEAADIDKDGIKELLMESMETNKDSVVHPTLSVFDSNDKIYSTWTDQSAAGDAELLIDEDNSYGYVRKTYSTKYSYRAYNTWTQDGWFPSSIYEKDDEQVLTCVWNGNDSSEEDWVANEKVLNLRNPQNDIQIMTNLEVSAKTNTTADALMEYFTEDNIEAYYIEADSQSGLYYIVIDDYHPSTWDNRKNEDLSSDEEWQSSYSKQAYDLILIVKPVEYGSAISCKLFSDELDMQEVRYEEGIVIVDSKGTYLYDIGSEDELRYIRKLNLDDVEKSLLSSKWYTMQDEDSKIIYEYEFRENGTIEWTQYEYSENEWIVLNNAEYKYQYDPDANELFVNYGQDSNTYIYIDENKGFVSLSGYMYGNCLVSFDSFPNIDELFEACDKLMRKSGNMGETTEEASQEFEKVLTQENVLTAIQNYCYSTNPALKDMSQEEHCFYWEVTDVTDSEYIVTYRSYTGSFVYYHVNINSGNVTTTEYVPGITDGEVPGTETFNIWDYMV